MFKFILIFFLLIIKYSDCCERPTSTVDPSQQQWWSISSFYQIYPRSFKDSNGDGVGDLNGIIEKLSYLRDIGINATWLSPIFKSPLADFGYDISDFIDIQPEYGTLADFDRLVHTGQQLGVKIILDFVPNHSSDEHQWFDWSVNKVAGYEDYYIWHPGYVDPTDNTKRLVPCNWISVFGGSAWTWNSVRQEYYYHQFSPKQPDLNFRNPKVVDEMKNVLRFWLNRGVSGFRIDAVPHLFEVAPNADNRYPDEPLSGTTTDPTSWNYLTHDYTFGQPETMDMVYQWREVLDEYSNEINGHERIMMLESYSPIDVVMEYFGNSTHEGAQIPFNFQLMSLTAQSMASDWISTINVFWLNMPKGRSANWVIGNHDNTRVGTRLGENKIDLINMVLLSLPGASVTYYGEEIGMLNSPIAITGDDRDPVRTPFQWDDTINGGFSTASETWLPVATNYKDVNVKLQLSVEKSHLKCYLEMMKYRKTNTWKYGELKMISLNENKVLAIMRHLNGATTFITLANIGSTAETINLTQFLGQSQSIQLEYYVVQTTSTKIPGDNISSDRIPINANEAVVLKSTILI